MKVDSLCLHLQGNQWELTGMWACKSQAWAPVGYDLELRYRWRSEVLVAQSCPTLSDPRDWGLPDSSVHGILQSRKLEWIAIPSCMGSSWPRDQTCISCGSCIAGGFFTTEPLGKPSNQWYQPLIYLFSDIIFFPFLKKPLLYAFEIMLVSS